jgi:hypothetical protein
VKKIGLLIIAILVLSAPAQACGWYLMGPPRDLDGWMVYTADGSLTTWQQVQIFDTAEDCRHTQWEKTQSWLFVKRPEDDPKKLDRYWADYNWTSHLRCVASDDPRLAR